MFSSSFAKTTVKQTGLAQGDSATSKLGTAFGKPLLLAICVAMAGCASQSAASNADNSHWWSFGSDKSPATASAPAKPAPAPAAPVSTANAASAEGSHWWWPFGDSAAKSATPVATNISAVPLIDPKVTQAWLDQYEPRMREAIKGSQLQLERRDNVLAITLPVDSTFNPKRPEMLLPVTLGPLTRVAKAVEGDSSSAVLILGHADTSGVAAQNLQVSTARAGSIAAIFHLSGLERNRLMTKGMGSVMPRAANDSAEGRALNRRVEILLTPQSTMLALLDHYNQATPPATVLALNDTPAAPAKPAAPAAATKKAPATTKKAPAKKVAAKAPVKAPAKPAATPKKSAAKPAASDSAN